MEKAINLYLDSRPTYRGPMYGLYDPSESLGFNNKFSKAQSSDKLQEQIDLFIADLETEFDLIFITDRFDESLVLLKEMMGWEMSDILYRKRLVNEDNISRKDELSTSTKERILKNQLIDTQMYEHFNTSLNEKIDQIGREKFTELVADFHMELEEFNRLCLSESQYRLQCRFLTLDDVKITRMLTELQISDDYTNLGKLTEYNSTFKGREGLDALEMRLETDKDIKMILDIQKEYDYHKSDFIVGTRRTFA